MNIGFQNKNKNQSIVLTNFPTNVEIKELHNKLYEFLRHFGNVIQLIYKDESDKNKSYAIVRFDNENSTNNLRFSLNLVPFLGSYLFVDKEKTIQLIMPKCEYTIVNEENNSNILEITNIPKEVGEENIKGMFERFGKIIHLDIVHTQYETVTAYAYYCNAAVAKKTKRKMNRGKIENRKVEIKYSSPIISSCLCISNINFDAIDINNLIIGISKFGEIKILEIYEEKNCLYVDFREINSSIELKKNLSDNSLYDSKDIKVEFSIPFLNDYKIGLKEDNKIEENNKKRANDVKEDTSLKKVKTVDNTKEEPFESRPRKGNKKRYKASHAFWGDSGSIASDVKKEEINNDNNNSTSSYKNDDIKKDTKGDSKENIKVDVKENIKENIKEEKKVDIKKEDQNKSIVLNERKPVNRIKYALKNKKIKFSTEIVYKHVGLNMLIYYIDGDKDKPNKIFEKNDSIKFRKMKRQDEFFDQLSDRLGRINDPSWSLCIGCINDDGDYTQKMKDDFDNLKKFNENFKDSDAFLLYKEGNTYVALLPSDYKYIDLFDQVFVRETTEEKQIKNGLGMWPFFIFVIFNEDSTHN